MNCERCEELHDGSYGSGRFCTEKCARIYSKRSKVWQIPREEFIVIANSCVNYTEFCEKLQVGPLGKNGRVAAGNGFVALKLRCERLGITHFKLNKYKRRDEFLLPIGAFKKRGGFRSRIIRDKLLPYQCAKCENPGEWQGTPLALHLHHKNGKSHDHRLDNVEFLCPNCHAQTENWTGRNIGKN